VARLIRQPAQARGPERLWRSDEEGTPAAGPRRDRRMNYRHGFHAGNFADVFKHALLARILSHLTKKDAPFRVIDRHAGEVRNQR
jgi:hypothetical protein